MSGIRKFLDTNISFVGGVAGEEMAILVYQGKFSSACWPSMLVALHAGGLAVLLSGTCTHRECCNLNP